MEYEKEQRVKRTQRDYSFAFKMLIVHEVEKGQITYKQAQAKYESYRVCRRPSFLRECPDEKSKIYP